MKNTDRYKYRVWDSQDDKMLYNAVDYHMIGLEQEANNIEYLTTNQYDGRLIPLHCTGLKDKNGKLIYEGDKVLDADKNEYVVEWGEPEAGFYLYQADSSRTFYFDDDSKNYEVIGNQYENLKN